MGRHCSRRRGRPALGRFDSLDLYRLMAGIGATSPFTMASAKVGFPPVTAIAPRPAGDRRYLCRFATKRMLSTDTANAGGNATLLSS